MSISNQNFKPEIQELTKLIIRTKYFSRSANITFTFISIDNNNKEVKIGINGILKKLSFFDFNKKYLRDGVIED